ncbi:Uncharacterized protein TCM_046155 [Theobroma cacao]|uniref:Uncharacterized protein n=1 Tax=Theobroma cacao TaxID=3641 RepID=S1S488_THECC|nr:Uncharacterized protein TCM_046155 [Theobroma cacao]
MPPVRRSKSWFVCRCGGRVKAGCLPSRKEGKQGEKNRRRKIRDPVGQSNKATCKLKTTRSGGEFDELISKRTSRSTPIELNFLDALFFGFTGAATSATTSAMARDEAVNSTKIPKPQA